MLAIQHGEAIFTLSASFQLPQPGWSTPSPRPTGVPAPGGAAGPGGAAARGADAGWLTSVPRPLDLRFVEAPLWSSRRGPATDEPQRVWMRADGTLPDDPLLHVCLLTYASDLTLLGSVLARARPLHMGDGQMASLDHAMWFHRPFRADEWLLYDVLLAERVRGAGPGDGAVLHPRRADDRDAVQEGLVRLREEQ